MDQSIGFSDRRSLIATLALLPLAACATPMGRYTVEDAVRRLDGLYRRLAASGP